jgi:hypothetical protein
MTAQRANAPAETSGRPKISTSGTKATVATSPAIGVARRKMRSGSPPTLSNAFQVP